MKNTTLKPFNYKTGRLIVVGASAGGLKAITALIVVQLEENNANNSESNGQAISM